MESPATKGEGFVQRQKIESRQAFVYPMPVVRGICILGVILIHVATGSTLYGQSATFADCLIFSSCLSRFAVPVFIILSGFSLSLNLKNEKAISFYRRTIKFLLIPYVIYSISYSAFLMRKSGDAMILIRNLLTGFPHLWFILLILQFYLLHPFLSRWYRGRKSHGMIVISAFLIQIAWNIILYLLWSSGYSIARFGVLCFVAYLGYFLGGYYFLEHADAAVRFFRNRMLKAVAAFFWIFSAAGLTVLVGIPESQNIGTISSLRASLGLGILTPLITLASFVSIYAFVQNHDYMKNMAFRLFHSLGLYSYGIFFLHAWPLWFMSWILRRVFSVGFDHPLFYVILFPATTVLSLISVRTLSKMPFGGFLT
jgi:surface polysaccharide O-acyltransferase-like enzyme